VGVRVEPQFWAVCGRKSVYEVIDNNEVRKVVTFHVNNNLCFFKHEKKIIARYDVGDL